MVRRLGQRGRQLTSPKAGVDLLPAQAWSASGAVCSIEQTLTDPLL